MLTLADGAPVPTGGVTIRRSIRNHCIGLAASAVFLVLGLGTLGATIKLSGAVIAAGSLVVKSSVKKVSHQTGGRIGALMVEEGSRVTAGTVMLKLDATVAQAEVAALTHELYQLQAQRERLEAERDGVDTLVYPPDLVSAARDTAVERILGGEHNLFALRRLAHIGQRKQLEQRIAELHQQVAGFLEQRQAKERELGIVSKEMIGVRDLFARNLVQITRIDALARDEVRVTGERGALTADIAQTEAKIAETRLQVIQVDNDLRSEVGKQLADNTLKLSDVTERRVAALDRLHSLEIRAPQAGFVHELAVHAPGAVVTPSEIILVVVPDTDQLVAEVRVAPHDIDKVKPAQAAILRFPSFNQRTTPEMEGAVARVAANTTDDPRGGFSYYTVQISLAPTRGMARQELRPGMPVDAYFRTGERTMLSYLVKPLIDQMRRAFRED